MSTIYLNNHSKPIRPPHSNDCNGHNTSISVWGNGHWVGDGYKYDMKTLSVKMANTVDYLRSKGYALPWMDLSVEDLVKYGWIKLKEN